MENFTVISVNNEYLKASEKNQNAVEWTNDLNEAIWFEHTEEANRFAKGRFSFGVNWELVEILYSIDDDEIMIKK